MTDVIYKSYNDLKENPPQADIYIVGSDQVWYDSLEMDSAAGWFLQFRAEAKRVSYAASIGRNLNESEIPIFRNYLSNFDAISVREESTNELCARHGIKAQICIDPTMLLPTEFYQSMMKGVLIDEKYAFLYYLNVKTADDIFWSLIKDYLEEKKLNLKYVTGSGYYQARDLIEGNESIPATIPEWIGLISHAECVFTTSFHGTVFSILMHRPFLTIGLQGRNEGANVRMENLLSKLGIPERMLNSEKTVKEQMEAPIDWQAIDLTINSMRQDSIAFLQAAIN